MDLPLSDLDVQLLARQPTYQHALASGNSFASILAGLRKLNDTLGESSRKAPIGPSTGDSDDSALGTRAVCLCQRELAQQVAKERRRREPRLCLGLRLPEHHVAQRVSAGGEGRVRGQQAARDGDAPPRPGERAIDEGVLAFHGAYGLD